MGIFSGIERKARQEMAKPEEVDKYIELINKKGYKISIKKDQNDVDGVYRIRVSDNKDPWFVTTETVALVPTLKTIEAKLKPIVKETNIER